ncbi:MAG: DUF389 domain-containing protein [Chitinophagaceae bacterium]|jgi:uncharacterized hydrophobic protein (TIGR00271 family)|nr:DUF389 domain-containing protein [Chitinophagaceae bacterium]
MNMPLQSLKRLWALPKEEHEQETYREIVDGVVFQGHNLWLLAAAMVIACVGLNAGNNAAIIGAMLISPLMGPVIGFGFGVSISKRSLLWLSVKNWLIMVGTSLLASSLFFLVTPFHDPTKELDSFLQGTLFDVILAFVGGVAGFVGIIRKEAIKVMAGVAVATACIPPLCTAGYGIANLRWEYFAGGFYFFLINCFFIGLGTWATSYFLNFQRYFKTARTSLHGLSRWAWLVGILLVLPSVYLAYLKWEQVQLDRHATQYVEEIRTQYPSLVIVRHEAYRKEGQRFLDISLLNDSTAVAGAVLQAANDLDTSMHVIWHFAPASPAPETRWMVQQLKRMDSLVRVQDSLIRRLSASQQNHPVE